MVKIEVFNPRGERSIKLTVPEAQTEIAHLLSLRQAVPADLVAVVIVDPTARVSAPILKGEGE